MKEKIMHFVKEVLPYVFTVFVVLCIKEFVFSTVLVSGASMNDTLESGDLMILDKVSYRLGDIKRFDIVVVQVGNQKLIKRVIGLPGEYIEYKENTLYVDGKKIEDNSTDEITNDFSIKNLELEKIPEDCYFVLGDNRDDSLDSRIFGVVSKDDILGKAEFILFPFNRFGGVN